MLLTRDFYSFKSNLLLHQGLESHWSLLSTFRTLPSWNQAVHLTIPSSLILGCLWSNLLFFFFQGPSASVLVRRDPEKQLCVASPSGKSISSRCPHGSSYPVPSLCHHPTPLAASVSVVWSMPGKHHRFHHLGGWSQRIPTLLLSFNLQPNSVLHDPIIPVTRFPSGVHDPDWLNNEPDFSWTDIS